MSEQRIILANSSRLLREMLNRILLKAEHLKVVQEVTDHNDLPAIIEQREAEWILMSLPVDGQLPEWTKTFLRDHPRMRIMTFAPDGSWVRMKWLEIHEERLTDLSLQDLIHILESNPDHM
jgi:DNA-binding NarL/FixJ family response regulator